MVAQSAELACSIRGLASRVTPAPSPASTTANRIGMPSCGAASPTPGTLRIAATISSQIARVPSVTAFTGAAETVNRRSGHITNGRGVTPPPRAGR